MSVEEGQLLFGSNRESKSSIVTSDDSFEGNTVVSTSGTSKNGSAKGSDFSVSHAGRPVSTMEVVMDGK